MMEPSPDITALQQRIAALPPEKRALFERLRADAAPSEPKPVIIPRQPPAQDRPLSWAQERLWILHQLEPSSSAYTIALRWRFSGALDIAALQQSLNQIVERHESLRTAFSGGEHSGSDQPVQRIQPSIALSMPVIDLRALPEPEQAGAIHSLCQRTAREPFDLTQPPLLRTRLLQLADQPNQQFLLILTLHHIVADGWSRGVLLRELTALYNANLTGQPAPLPALPIQYSDFALWQRQQDFTASLTYWQRQLEGLQPLELPTDYPRSPVSSFRSTTQSVTLPPSLLADLKTVSRQAGTTLFMTLLAAFKILLHRYSQQSDIAVGVPIANRHPAEVEPLIGFFVNTLVLRTDLSGNPKFRTVLERVRQVTASAYQHQDLPFAQLVAALHPQRHFDQNPLFQVMVQFQSQGYELQNALTPELNLLNLTLTQDWIDTGYTKFDLTWHLVERHAELLAVVEYRTDLYEPDTVARMLGHFQVLLSSIARNPDQRISELPLLTATEQQQRLDWNQTHRDAALGQRLAPFLPDFLPDRFEAQVAQTPDRIAAVYQEQQVTYQELDTRANQLAHFLQAQGIGCESRVGICLHRSLELLVALLGILKAGAAYVPLDPSYPAERLRWMIEDAQIHLLLIQSDIKTDTDFRTFCAVCVLDYQWPQIATYPPLPPPRTLSGLNLAYLIYTSGSTGNPKGTMLTHGGLSNYLDWCLRSYFPQDSADASAANSAANSEQRGFGAPVQSSIGFDATITSLYAPLLAGHPILLLPEEAELERLSQALTAHSFSLLKLTPAHLQLLSQWQLDEQSDGADWQTNCRATVVVGGEALMASHLRDWQRFAPQSCLINEYGPTETVVGCCVYAVPADPKISHTSSIPIGHPILNTELYILDEYLQPVPIGVPGELYIGGIGVGRGYFQRPALTAERFIPNPFAADGPCATRLYTRLYKTGDRARYRRDGTIDYLGRIDQQVKLRGFRIELEEIAAVLGQHPRIQAATVTVNTDQLVAYVVWRDAHQQLAPTVLSAALRQEMRQFLQSQLPDYMLPSRFVSLPELPLTANGKLDRAALPDPEMFALSNADAESSTSAIEAQLVAIWSELLGVSVNANDNFFELGGDSILGLQVIARAKRVGIVLTPRQLFQHQTIAELAAHAKITEAGTGYVAEQGIITGPVPLTPIQHWLMAQQLPNPHHVNQALLLEVVPTLSAGHLQASLRQLWLHHDALRLRLDPSGHYSVHSDISDMETPSLEIVDLSALPLPQQAQQVTQIANALQASLDLFQTLGRSVWFRMGHGQPDRLLLILHHWIVDGVSWRILLEDLTTVYAQLERGESMQLPLKTAAFRDWAMALQAEANSAATEAELDYWLSQSAALTLPLEDTDRHPNAASSTATDEIRLSLAIELTRQLLEEGSRLHHARIDELLLTAVAHAMRQWLGTGTLLLDLEHHGRSDAIDLDVSRTVGWLTTIAPIALPLNHQSLPDTLKQVKETLRSLPRDGLSYGLLRYLDSNAEIQVRLAQLPAAPIKFNYLGQLDRAMPSSSWILGWARESVGQVISPLNPRAYSLEINAWIAQQQLHTNWVCCASNRSRIEPIAQAYQHALLALAQPQTTPSSYTPSDFPAAKLNQKQLDQLIRKLQPGRTRHD